MHIKAALHCRDASDFIQVSLKLHKLGLFGLDNFGEACDLYLCFLLILLILRLHLEQCVLLVEELII